MRYSDLLKPERTAVWYRKTTPEFWQDVLDLGSFWAGFWGFVDDFWGRAWRMLGGYVKCLFAQLWMFLGGVLNRCLEGLVYTDCFI